MKIKLKLPTIEECNLTAEDWDLFTNAMDCNDAANALNAAVLNLLSS